MPRVFTDIGQQRLPQYSLVADTAQTYTSYRLLRYSSILGRLSDIEKHPVGIRAAKNDSLDIVIPAENVQFRLIKPLGSRLASYGYTYSHRVVP